MKKISLQILALTIFLISTLALSVLAFDLEAYPYMLINKEGKFNAIIVLGDTADAADAIGAIDIATSLQYELKNPIEIGTTLLASEVEDITKVNSIVVGGPCANPIAARLMGFPQNCLEGFNAGKAKIKLFEHENGKFSILVAGRTGMDTRRAARVLASGKDFNIKGKELEVSETQEKTLVIA